MREVFDDLFEIDGDLLCITTNMMVNRRGENVMGGGCAARANKLFPGLARHLGTQLLTGGNHVYFLGEWDRFDLGTPVNLASFPTKTHWARPSTLGLINHSAKELAQLIAREGFQNVLLPRPGCGLGGLQWEDVKPLLEKHLDDRVIIVSFAEDKPCAV